MKLIELHILQSFPVSCLNRDDVGAPKSATFGGVPRARVSSQSQKRATRFYAKDLGEPGRFEGIRTRHLSSLFFAALQECGVDDPETVAKELCITLSKEDAKKEGQVTTAVYLSPGEIKEIVGAIAEGESVKKAVKGAQRKDAADIALFGRMIANDASLNVEGAAMFSHALSTHQAANDIDFYSAVDDFKEDAEDAGAGMIGTLEFNSALYYRYAGVNLDMLADDAHLGMLSVEERRAVMDSFLRATLQAVPGARKNSMNGHTAPGCVLGIAKTNGQPLQLVNAFENPVWSPGKGYLDESRTRMLTHHDELKKTWGIETDEELIIPDVTLNEFVTKLISHVV